MYVPGLRYACPLSGIDRQIVTFQYRHTLKMIGQYAGSGETGNTAAYHDGMSLFCSAGLCGMEGEFHGSERLCVEE